MAALRVCVSAASAERLAAARNLLRNVRPGSRVLLVGASRGAADDLARSVAAAGQATFGIERLSLTQLAARTAISPLAASGLAPSTYLGAEAVAARAVFDAAREGRLHYFDPVASTPGFPRALARTLQELRLGGVPAGRLPDLPLGGPDLAHLLERFESCFADAASADRARLFATAARLAGLGRAPDAMVLLDVPLPHAAERALIEVLAGRAAATLATIPLGDRELAAWYARLGAETDCVEPAGVDDLARVRRYLFASDVQSPPREQDGSLELFSAPGEGREAVEIARRVLREARRGVRFDEMAILIRTPHAYFGLVEQALARAGIPGWFDRGTRRPHPAGRAFLALLACRAEQLSAARFAEYLSLGQVPQPDGATEETWASSRDDVLAGVANPAPADSDTEDSDDVRGDEDERAPVAAGTLRAPWRWEKLLIDAAVIGRDAGRWRRRLDGIARELERQRREAERVDGPDGGRARGIAETLAQLEHLQAFALPIVDTLAAWPPQATWGDWLDRFEGLAPRVLRAPVHVLRVLADLRPMAAVGPIDLDEARRVLSERLLTVETDSPARRYGRVFVGTPQQARGRTFRVVFVPGLAERMFPQKRREDPLLLDAQRLVLGMPALAGGAGTAARGDSVADTTHDERLLLQLAAGAASERLYISYPRIELSEARARVPSFYALDVMRAATGHVPDHEWLEQRAREVGSATLAWPAPPRAEDAIDDQEHDLAVLRGLLDHAAPAEVRGYANYLLQLNAALRRSVRDRWARGSTRWSSSDGVLQATPFTRTALAAQRLTARPYSLTALQRFSACPYQFALAAFYRLQPLAQPEPFQRMDPLTRGSLFHEVQARFFRTLADTHGLPVTAGTLVAAQQGLDDVVETVTAAAYQELAPAVERVWQDEVTSLRRDLHAWLDRAARDGGEWIPRHFEFAFGRVRGERDPASVAEPVRLEGGFLLNGAIDLIEEQRATGVLRVTDHKTGRKPDRIERTVVAGGAVLQPVLYAMVVEVAMGRPVESGRLFYCTTAGGFTEHVIALDDRTRASGREVLEIIDRAIELGRLPASPGEGACDRCDFRPVCGPGVFQRVRRKPVELLADLHALRNRP